MLRLIVVVVAPIAEIGVEGQHAAGQQVVVEAAQRLQRVLLAHDTGEAAAGHVDAGVALGQVERLHRLAVQHRG